MKPKAPKKKDIKPSAKSGEVRESNPYEYKSELFKSGLYKSIIPTSDFVNKPLITMIIKSNIGTFALYSDGSSERIFDFNNSDKDK